MLLVPFAVCAAGRGGFTAGTMVGTETGGLL